jgi:hypothetical protein
VHRAGRSGRSPEYSRVDRPHQITARCRNRSVLEGGSRPDDHLQLEASPTPTTRPDSVVFTASTDDHSDLVVQSWSWKPDSIGDPTSACSGSVNPCKTMVHNSGTMQVKATVHGATRVAGAHVTVPPDHLELESKPSWGYAGASIVFASHTMHGSSYQVDHWSWIPDVAPGSTTTCLTTDTTCTVSVQETGRMRVVGTVNGRLDSADARVRIVKCPQGDSLLDNPTQRDSMRSRWALSNADGPISLRLEKPSVTYKLEDGGYLTLPVNMPGETPCSNDMANAVLASGPPNSTLVGWEHTHPFAAGDTTPTICHPGDSTQTHAYSTANGGPSLNDWAIGANVPPFNTIPGFIQDKKSIYKFPNGLTDSTKWNSKNVRKFKRKFLDDPACQ